MSKEEIDFEKDFRDTRYNEPEEGDVIAIFRCEAQLIDSDEKRQIIKLLKQPEKALICTVLMKKIHKAIEVYSYKVPRQMAEDLLAGMSEDEVAKKPHEYVLQSLFYAKKENIPEGDPHWSHIKIPKLEGVSGKQQDSTTPQTAQSEN